MNDDNSNRKIVPHYHTNGTHKTLGVIIAPDNNNEAQVALLKNIDSRFGDSIRRWFIKGHAVMHALFSTVMRSFNWSIPAITTSKEEYTYIVVPIIKTDSPNYR